MHTDTHIINEYIKNKYIVNLDSPIVICGRDYTFSQQQVPGIPIYMTLPNEIKQMEPHSQKIKYPNENRPDIILTISTDETVNFLFSQTQELIMEQDIPEIAQAIQAVIKRMHANTSIYQSGESASKLSTIYWFDYTTAALDHDIYNIMYLLCLNDTLFIGGFCCLKEHSKQWEPLVLQMIATLTKQEENNE